MGLTIVVKYRSLYKVQQIIVVYFIFSNDQFTRWQWSVRLVLCDSLECAQQIIFVYLIFSNDQFTRWQWSVRLVLCDSLECAVPFLQDWEHRQEEDRLLIERILLVVRNILHIPPNTAREMVRVYIVV